MIGFDDAPPPSERSEHGAWLAVLVASSFLISPLLFHAWRNAGQRPLDLLFAFNLVTSVLWIVLLHLWTQRPVILHLILLPLYLTVAIDLFLVDSFGARLSTGYLNIALTNHGDAGELLATYARPLALAFAGLVVVYLPCLYGMRNLRRRPATGWASLLAVVLVCVYASAIGRDLRDGYGGRQAALDVAGKELSSPVGVIFQTAVAIEMHARSAELRKQRATYEFLATKPASSEKEIYVLVIGESSRPQNWSLFGYPRDTTPHMRKTPGVVPLPEVLTTAPHTDVAVPSMLSLESIEHWASIVAKKSIVQAFNDVGFRTYWLSAQGADSWAGLIPQIAAESRRRRYFDAGYDGAMLGEMRSVLADAKSTDKIFIVLHTKGSHFEYARRYPKEFARFKTAAPNARQALVDEYDNSVSYTDWFLGEVIAELNRQGSRSVLVYASDHGENLLDDDRQFLGHALGTRYDLAAAALVWVSGELARSRPDQIQALRANAGAKLSLSNIAHSMLDVAGIQTKELDRRQSIFSSEFAAGPRFYMLRGELHAESPVGASNSISDK